METFKENTCRFCKYYKYDFEYKFQGLGICENDEVTQCRILFTRCDDFYITDDFGCLFFKKINS